MNQKRAWEAEQARLAPAIEYEEYMPGNFDSDNDKKYPSNDDMGHYFDSQMQVSTTTQYSGTMDGQGHHHHHHHQQYDYTREADAVLEQEREELEALVAMMEEEEQEQEQSGEGRPSSSSSLFTKDDSSVFGSDDDQVYDDIFMDFADEGGSATLGQNQVQTQGSEDLDMDMS